MDNITFATEKLCFGFARTMVLHDLSLQFEPGTFHGIIGPNGSGKSTLIDLLAGYQKPVSGTVTMNNVSPTRLTAHALAKSVAVVPQETTFNFPFTVFDAVLMGRHPYIPRFSRPNAHDALLVNKAMDVMDITALAHRSLSELSGGERQRTVFARALAQDTPSLLLDEPTSSMDIRHTLTAMEELRNLAHTKGCTVIAVLHDLNLAAGYCDYITVLNKGRITLQAPPSEALTPARIRDVFNVRAEVLAKQNGIGLTITYNSKD